jgi:two-component system, NtrC family, nitrogen regulation response regulator GlnG
MVDHEATLRFGPSDPSGQTAVAAFPALTIVWHPRLDRVGQVALLWPAIADDGGIHLSRDEPTFGEPGLGTGRPLDHRAIGRRETPALDIRYKKGSGYELERRDQQIEIAVNLEPLVGSRHLSGEEVRTGVVITVGRHFVSCLHLIRTPVTRSSVPGLLGTSDAIEDLRQSILRAAKRKTFVLLRGESGTGKELAARALHDGGPRAKGPFIPLNMATLGGDQARAELFGYRKGAFTGATADFPGYFRSAAGGTIFLDEIGFLTSDVQPMLLRVLDDQEILPMGTSQPVKVDVRVIAATDRNLEELVEKQQFERPLYNRLDTAISIRLAPLRERREDVGCLLVQFLRNEAGDAVELQRFLDDRPSDRPWLWAADVAAVASSPLAGNARDLLGLARNLVEKGSEPPYDTHSVVKGFLVRRDPASSQRDASTVSSTSVGGTDLTNDRILELFEMFHGNRGDVAAHLAVSRITLWRRICKSPNLKRIIEQRWARHRGKG